jgi:hypothetical protein
MEISGLTGLNDRIKIPFSALQGNFFGELTIKGRVFSSDLNFVLRARSVERCPSFSAEFR